MEQYELDLREKHIKDDNQLELPLAEVATSDTAQATPQRQVCIGNCKICPYCDGN